MSDLASEMDGIEHAEEGEVDASSPRHRCDIDGSSAHAQGSLLAWAFTNYPDDMCVESGWFALRSGSAVTVSLKATGILKSLGRSLTYALATANLRPQRIRSMGEIYLSRR